MSFIAYLPLILAIVSLALYGATDRPKVARWGFWTYIICLITLMVQIIGGATFIPGKPFAGG